MTTVHNDCSWSVGLGSDHTIQLRLKWGKGDEVTIHLGHSNAKMMHTQLGMLISATRPGETSKP